MPEFRVYVVELSAAACSRTDCASRRTGKPHVYVGETKKTPEERLADHRAGGFTSRPVVREPQHRPASPPLPGHARVQNPDGIEGGGGTARRPSEEAWSLRVRRATEPTLREPASRCAVRPSAAPHDSPPTERSTT